MKDRLSLLPDLIKQLIKYGLIGLANVIIYFGVNYFLINNFPYFERHLITTSIIAGVISFMNGLYFNRKWTFKSETHWVRDSVYILVIFGICTVIQNGIYAWMIQYFQQKSDFKALENHYLFYSQFCGVIAFAAFNFTLNKLITFRTPKVTETN
jgi:putative flippase GtrA